VGSSRREPKSLNPLTHALGFRNSRVRVFGRANMALTRVFGATAGRAFMAAAAKSAAKVKAAPSGGAARKPAVKKTTMVRTNTGIQKAVPVSSELGSFVGASEVSRTFAVKKVWEYIKQQNLQVLFPFSINAAISLHDLSFSAQF